VVANSLSSKKEMILKPICCLLLCVNVAVGLKILMYQIAFSNTHMPFSGVIADTLIDRGHTIDKIIIAYHSGEIFVVGFLVCFILMRILCY
jgi:hypothetical protein